MTDHHTPILRHFLSSDKRSICKYSMSTAIDSRTFESEGRKQQSISTNPWSKVIISHFSNHEWFHARFCNFRYQVERQVPCICKSKTFACKQEALFAEHTICRIWHVRKKTYISLYYPSSTDPYSSISVIARTHKNTIRFALMCIVFRMNRADSKIMAVGKDVQWDFVKSTQKFLKRQNFVFFQPKFLMTWESNEQIQKCFLETQMLSRVNKNSHKFKLKFI